MASKVKQLFHRKKGDDNASRGQHEPYPSGGEPALRMSLYDTTVAGGLPQTGDYPIKGNDSSVALTRNDRKSSVRSRRSAGSQNRFSRRSTTPDHYAGQANLGASSPPPTDIVNSDLQALNYQRSPSSGRRQNENPKRWSNSQLPQDFSNLNIGHNAPTTVTHTVTTTHFSSSPQGSRGYAQNTNNNHQPPNNSSIRSVNESAPPRALKPPARNQVSINRSTHPSYTPSHGASQVNDSNMQHQQPIARKQVRASAVEHTYSPPAGESTLSHQKGGIVSYHDRPYSSHPLNSSNAPEAPPSANTMARQQSPPARTRQDPPTKAVVTSTPNAQDVIKRAETNTAETHVTESVAPAITQELVHSNMHHVREEVITREIHEHDVYHRVLPVIDVEVLPPRHFLPVEGGGLVEMGAKEVPGRGNHWVIAETASKIPSDQAAPTGRRPFSARQFAGRAGDDKKYIGAEGQEITEQTWVHPPELETGARDTGQTWPMVFGETSGDQKGREQTSLNPGKKRRSRRASEGY